ncbi:Spermidine N1-acetyltransferase [Klebsiella variicola]|uniref:Spermidine N1-acetyltransferase n=1 Tax=Klebsiella variicola TaxID=244366 RepID=A0A7H4MJL8_KLEVA|nr:Spermidine N1-acetyltransferase [Klebsiella variicola]STU73712.1 Spermidine N1-acetyltransferase [Klebsiella variicola]
MTDALHVKLRPLEREDLRFVHQLDNNASVMRYWFEEPYEAFVELSDLYDKHIHDQSERRFVIECNGDKAGLVELVEINHVHRRPSSRSLSHRTSREKALPLARRGWPWTTVLRFLICISCI